MIEGPPAASGRDGDGTDGSSPFSLSQQRILQLVSDGCSGAEVGAALDLTVAEVAGQLAEIRQLLAVRSTRDAVTLARSRDLLN